MGGILQLTLVLWNSVYRENFMVFNDIIPGLFKNYQIQRFGKSVLFTIELDSFKMIFNGEIKKKIYKILSYLEHACSNQRKNYGFQEYRKSKNYSFE